MPQGVSSFVHGGYSQPLHPGAYDVVNGRLENWAVRFSQGQKHVSALAFRPTIVEILLQCAFHFFLQREALRNVVLASVYGNDALIKIEIA